LWSCWNRAGGSWHRPWGFVKFNVVEIRSRHRKKILSHNPLPAGVSIEIKYGCTRTVPHNIILGTCLLLGLTTGSGMP
jgi:hypothetical protein